MNLTPRDIEIVNYIKEVRGATIEQIQYKYFPSYVTASIRLKKLQQNNYLKRKQHPTIGKIVYFSEKLPSYHDLIVNDILIALKGKYIDYKPKPKLGRCIPDMALYMTNGRFLIIEIEIFNRVTKEKISNIHQSLTDKPHDIWIITKWASNHKRNRINIKEINKLSDYY